MANNQNISPLSTKMSNDFDIHKYFLTNYGLGNPPSYGGFKIPFWSWIFLIASIALYYVMKSIYIALIPLAIFLVFGIMVPLIKAKNEKGALDEWQRNYKIRNERWHEGYDNFVSATLAKLDLKHRGINKLCIDESQIDDIKSEDDDIASGVRSFAIETINHKGRYRIGPDGKIRTEFYEVTWLYFTKDEILTYNVEFSLLDTASKIELTNEMFFKNIVTVSTGAQTVDIEINNNVVDNTESKENVISQLGKKKKEVATKVGRESFSLTVPGDKISFTYVSSEQSTESINGLVRLIRDKLTN